MNNFFKNLKDLDDRDTIGTSNKLFNELIGGGFDTQRYHVLIGNESSLNRVKEIIPEHESIVLMETRLGERHKYDGNMLRHKAMVEDLAYINLIEFQGDNHQSDWDHYRHSDTFMLVMEVPEGVTVKIAKQRKSVQHGYPNPCSVKL